MFRRLKSNMYVAKRNKYIFRLQKNKNKNTLTYNSVCFSVQWKIGITSPTVGETDMCGHVGSTHKTLHKPSLVKHNLTGGPFTASSGHPLPC